MLCCTLCSVYAVKSLSLLCETTKIRRCQIHVYVRRKAGVQCAIQRPIRRDVQCEFMTRRNSVKEYSAGWLAEGPVSIHQPSKPYKSTEIQSKILGRQRHPATQNASRKSSGDKRKEVRGQNVVDVYV